MKLAFCTWVVVVAVSASAAAQEFEVASIKPVEPVAFFHASDSSSGGPGSADAGMFRCTCSLSSLITKAFGLQRYQFPGQPAFSRDTFNVTAKIPEGTTQEQFLVMLQNLLKSRFGLQYHFEAKDVQGYQLVVAKNGPKLKESAGSAAASGGEQHSGSHGQGGFTMGQSRIRMDHQTTGQLAQLISNQLVKPVEDQTGLKGTYDILLSFSGDSAHDHAPVGGGGGSAFHGDHGGGLQTAPAEVASGPTLFDAVQSQLGLKLVPAKKTTAQIFIVDHINRVATDN